jgi:hypothetical protein
MITYNAYTFPLPSPFIEKENSVINYGGIWGQATKIKLKGFLEGESYLDTLSKQGLLVSGLSQDYKSLTISLDGADLNLDIAKVVSINFSQQNTLYISEYDVQFEGYESGLFNGTFGILDPINTYSFQENSNNSMTLNHKISAKGFNTSTSTNNALQNAQNFVNNLLGYDSSFKPIKIKDITYEPILTNISEKINRIEGIYSVEETYLIDLSGSDSLSYFTRYKINVDQNKENDFVVVSIDGDVTAPINNLPSESPVNMSDVRDYISNLDLKNICEDVVTGVTLFEVPSSLSFNENEKNKKIAFSCQFTSDSINNGVYFDYNINISYDFIQSAGVFEINGDIKTNGHLKDKYEKVKNYFDSEIAEDVENYLYEIVQSYYTGFKSSLGYSNSFALDEKCKNLSINKNPFLGQISISAAFSDDKRILNIDREISDISYAVKETPNMEIFSPRPTMDINGGYIIYQYDIVKNLKSKDLSIEISFKNNIDVNSAKSILDSYVADLQSSYSLENLIVLDENLNFNRASNTSYIKSLSYAASLQEKSSANTTNFLPGKISIT